MTFLRDECSKTIIILINSQIASVASRNLTLRYKRTRRERLSFAYEGIHITHPFFLKSQNVKNATEFYVETTYTSTACGLPTSESQTWPRVSKSGQRSEFEDDIEDSSALEYSLRGATHGIKKRVEYLTNDDVYRVFPLYIKHFSDFIYDRVISSRNWSMHQGRNIG